MTAPKDGVPRFDPATEAELDAAAAITLENIERAKEMWRANAPPELLDAQAEGASEA